MGMLVKDSLVTPVGLDLGLKGNVCFSFAEVSGLCPAGEVARASRGDGRMGGQPAN